MMIENLPSEIVETVVLCPHGSAGKAFIEAGIEVEYIPSVSKFVSSLTCKKMIIGAREILYLRSAKNIREAIRKYRPNIVHLNEWVMIHAAIIAKYEKVTVIMHARNVAERRNLILHRTITALINRYVDEMIAIDQSVRKSFKEVKSCCVVYNPSRSESIKGKEKKENGEIITVTLLAILLECKGVWELLEAAKMLNYRKDIVFKIAGGNSRNREFHESMAGKLCHIIDIAQDVEKQMKEYIRKEKLNNVIMMGEVKDVNELFEETDILAFPSHLNGPGRSVFEAGAYGIPSIVAMKDRVEDVVVDGETGIIVPEKDAIALKNAILKLADDGILRRKLGNGARKKYLVQFDQKKIAADILGIYTKWIGNEEVCRRSRKPW